jgi:putative tryptophan/tyrosine transport system substrate-binding protein
MLDAKRRQFITLLGSAAVVWPLAARAQQQDRPRQVAILFGGFSESDPEPRARIKAFKEQLQELGWTDGGNIRVQARMGRGRPDQVRAYAAELVGMMPDVLAANSGPALAALLRETRTIPIVFASILDPVGSGFVSSLAHPGGNATGFASLDPAITGKWLELLKEIAPKVTRVSAISDRDNPAAYAGFVRTMRDLAPSLGVEFKSDPVANLEDIERAIDSISSTPGGGLALMGTVASANRESIVRLSQSRRLPAVYQFGFYARSGGLISYGADSIDLWRRAGVYVDRILRGAKPADLPVQMPTKYELVINLKTARALGLTVPPTLLAGADEVIE